MSCKVFLPHPAAKDVSYIENALHFDENSRKRYSLEWDEEAPDVLFASEVILYDRKARETFKNLYNKADLCVFFPGEAIMPDYNIFDYSISFNGFDEKDDRAVRIPTRLFFEEYLEGPCENQITSILEAKKLLLSKNGFCNFIYSNPKGHPNRRALFDSIMRYKHVDSYGAYLNNMGLENSGGSSLTGLVLNSTNIKRGYKFTIAAENATFPGYTSEKILTSLEAGSIPIYWGNPKIDLDVNPETFINCHNYDNFEEVIERVKQVDEDDELWCDMVCKPWMTESQKKRADQELDRLHSFFDMIFAVKEPAKRRRAEGTWPDIYGDFWIGRELSSDKYRLYFEILSSFCKKIQSGNHICKKLGKDISSVAIYGMGEIGRILYTDIKACDWLEILYCIDNRCKADDIESECIRLSELQYKSCPDAVIVTVPGDFEVIKNSIMKVFDTRVFSVIDLLD